MRIVCPSCGTAYTVPDHTIGPKGRKVRCARCAERWHVEAVKASAPEPDMAEDDEGVPGWDSPMVKEPVTADLGQANAGADDVMDEDAIAKAFAAADTSGDAGDTAEDDVTDDVAEPAVARAAIPAEGGSELARDEDHIAAVAPEKTAVRPRIVAHHRPRPSVFTQVRQVVWRVRSFLFRTRILIGLTVFVLALALPVLGVVLRVPIVRAYPRIAGLYAEMGLPVNLTGLEFRRLNTLRELEGGQPVLVIEGAVGNLTMATVAMPGIRLALRGQDGQEIYAWSVEPKTATVPAGDEVRFRSRLAAPPEEAVDIQLRFTEPKTRHAVLP
jgi:predicted Zn finger-like uncharacterized protein